MAEQEMTPEQAVLFTEVYAPAFVEKAAELGLSFDSEEALGEAMETAALLKMSMHGKSQSVIKTANQRLKQHLGVDRLEAQAVRQGRIKTATQHASQNPDVRQALLANTLVD